MKTLWRLCGYIRYCKGDALLSGLMALVVAALGFMQIPLLIPIFNSLFSSTADQNKLRAFTQSRYFDHVPSLRTPVARLIDLMLAHPVEATWVALGVVFGANILKGFAAFTQEYMAGKVYTGVTRRLAADLYHHVMGLSMSFHNRAGSASIASHFTNDIEQVRFGMSFFFGRMLVEPLMLVACTIAAALVNWRLFIVNVVIFPPLAIGVRVLGSRAKKATRRGLHSRDRLMNILQETLEGVSIVKAFNMEAHEEERFDEENRNVRTHDMKVIKATAISGPFIEVMGIAGLALSMGTAAWMIEHEGLTFPEFVLFYGALISLFNPLRKLSNLNTRLQSLVAASTRVFDVLDERADIVDRPNASPMSPFTREICFNDVRFSYNGSDMVLKGVNLVARRGEIIALVGPSGAGKTTVARLIPRLYDVTSGRVAIDGADVRDMTSRSVHDQIGLVTQDVILFNDTIAGNIAYGRPGASQEEIERAARAANAHDFITQLPKGYDSVIGEKGLTLSGGQRQRIALARAIIKDPPILILDEATSSLDSESEFLIQRALDEFMKHRTSIVIAHRLSTIEKASRIYVLADGEVSAAGTNQELLAASPLYRNLYNRQFGLAEG